MVTIGLQMMRSPDLDEILGPEVGTRLARELGRTLRRRPAQEAGVAGLLRVTVGRSARLREAAAEGLVQLVHRKAFDRPLYTALLRSLVEVGDPRALPSLAQALVTVEGGGLPTIAAAALADGPELAPALLQVAASRSPHVAFAADVARVARGESDGALALSLAPRIKESHRIDLCDRFLLPLRRQGRKVNAAVPAISILRDAERHLGRWLCLAELAQLSGDVTVAERSRQSANEGAASARVAWSLVAWALGGGAESPSRPTVEVVARLSDRPSTERDLSFLFRMGEARLEAARSLLEGLVKGPMLTTEPAVRAASQLVKYHGKEELLVRLSDIAKGSKREPLRGLSLAAIADSHAGVAAPLSADVLESRHPASFGFAILVRLAAHRGFGPILTEANYRRLQLGWID